MQKKNFAESHIGGSRQRKCKKKTYLGKVFFYPAFTLKIRKCHAYNIEMRSGKKTTIEKSA
jgi:hypothetical protein